MEGLSTPAELARAARFQRARGARALFAWAGRNALTLIFLALCILLSATLPTFLTLGNWTIILQSSAIIGVMGFGLSFVMISGSFDLSFAATMLLAGAVSARIIMLDDQATVLALLAGPLAGAVVGVLNGTVVVVTGISPLLATIATAMLIRAFAVLYVMQTWMEIPRSAASFLWLGQGSLRGIPISIFLLAGVAAASFILLNRTGFGRMLYAVGASPRAARVAGLRDEAVRIGAFMICGACAGIAGVINVSSVGGLSAVFNISYLYDVITVVVVGGVSFFGGVGTVYGVALGLLIIGVLKNAMIILNTPYYAQSMVGGVFLLLAIGLDSWLRKRRAG